MRIETTITMLLDVHVLLATKLQQVVNGNVRE